MLPVLKCTNKAAICESTVQRREGCDKPWRESKILTAAVLLLHDTAKCSQSRREESCNQRQRMGLMWLQSLYVDICKRVNVKLSTGQELLPRLNTSSRSMKSRDMSFVFH